MQYGYIRVSTKEQKEDRQHIALRKNRESSRPYAGTVHGCLHTRKLAENMGLVMCRIIEKRVS